MTDRITQNRMIAEFMGGEVKYPWIGGVKTPCFYMPDSHITEYIHDFENETPYHSDWNWLMPVVKKCQTISSKKQVELKDIQDDLDNPNGWRAWSYRNINLNTDIERVYKSVIRFIEFYNSSL